MAEAQGGPYVTKQAVVDFAVSLKTDLTVADITDAMLTATTQMINKETDTYWQVYAGDLYVDGRGEDFIFSPIVPIVTLTAVKIIDIDTTEESLTVSGTDREVWFNEETGLIKRIDYYGSTDIQRDPDPGALFPEGVKNIKITGTFGRATYAELLAMLQTMLIIQMLRFKYPSEFNTDLISERIGEYEWRASEMQYSKDPKNSKKTLDGYISYLYSMLPQDDKLCVLAV